MENAARADRVAPVSAAPEAAEPASAPAEAAEAAAPASTGPVWPFLIRPRWLAWHAFMVLSVWGMLWLGDWQLHRALAGNPLSWAYTFEWPLFSGFAFVFWAKTIKDEFRIRRGEAVAGSAAVRGLDDRGLPVTARSAQEPQEPEDPELSAYNAYLTRLNDKAGRSQGHEWRS
jgi:hypothetical protein